MTLLDEPGREHAPWGPNRETPFRLDARRKATGRAIYTADVDRPGLVHAAVTRSPLPSARITAIDTTAARAAEGVLGVYTAADVTSTTYGRAVRDVPVLASGVVRYVGEPVAAVVARTRRQAERAAALVEVDYEELPAVTSPEEALAPGAPLVHEDASAYPGAFIRSEHGPNLQSLVTVGDPEALAAALRAAPVVIERVYTTPAGHQGYIEPWACVAEIDEAGKVRLFMTNKSPYRLREQIAACIGREPSDVVIEPITLGGDFGGKGSPELAPLCAELARLTGRPVRQVLRYEEDLIATNPRHPATLRVRLAADRDGRFLALAVDSLLDGGAYAAFKPSPMASIHGVLEAPGYRIPVFFAESRIAYTNTVPKGHMRAPGAPQMNFAVESAIDELAVELGMDPVELRRENLLDTGESDPNGHAWAEFRGKETLAAAIGAFRPIGAPPGWRSGVGLSVYNRGTATATSTSLCLVPVGDHRLRVEIPVVETGTGSHTVLRELLRRELGYAPEDIEVVQVSTEELPKDPGAGGSRVTASLAMAADEAVKAWRQRLGDEPVRVEVDVSGGPPVGSYGVQIAEVAVDPETGQYRVLQLLTAADVAEIINPAAHQMQIDGGAVQGFGFACLEDLDEDGGQVWAANLGDYKLPASRDVPALRTVLVPGGRGVGTANVKNIGETGNPPTAAAIANALFRATGHRFRALPVRAEEVWSALSEERA